MARHKEFDREVVLDRAMTAFWSRGYEATSVQDLVQRTGIHRGSLYNTFGDKQGLFLAALERYDRRITRRLLALLEGPGSGRAAIRAFFAAKVAYALAPRRPRGCLVTNSVVERARHDPETTATVAASLARMEDAFYHALRRARQAGEIGPRRNLRALARYLTMCAQGLTVVGKVQPDAAALRQIVGVALAALDSSSRRMLNGTRIGPGLTHQGGAE